MAADTYSNGLGLLMMGTGNDNNTWGTNANANVFQVLEDGICGRLVSAVTGGTLDLSSPAPPSAVSLARYKVLAFTGTLLSQQTIKVPAISKSWHVENNTSGDIYMQTPSGTLITIPKSTVKHVYCDATNVVRMDADEIGKLAMFAGASIPAGHLECDGSSLLRTAYPDLFTKITTAWGTVDLNHFTLPLLTDTGRFPRSRITGSTDVGTYQASAFPSHTHSGTVNPTGTTDFQGSHNHNAAVTDPAHTHSISLQTLNALGGGGSQGATGNNGSNTAPTTNSAATGISVAIDSQGSHQHNVSTSGTFITSSAGSGSETRPAAAVVRFCIRY